MKNKEELEKKTGVKCISSIDGIKKFDICLMNPPYDKTLHLKFLEKVIEFTDKVIEEVNKKEEPVVFIFWGNYARAKKVLITNPKHLVLESAHPSPFSAYNGFFGSRPFSKTNEFLIANGIKPIDWNIEKDL